MGRYNILGWIDVLW